MGVLTSLNKSVGNTLNNQLKQYCCSSRVRNFRFIIEDWVLIFFLLCLKKNKAEGSTFFVLHNNSLPYPRIIDCAKNNNILLDNNLLKHRVCCFFCSLFC